VGCSTRPPDHSSLDKGAAMNPLLARLGQAATRRGTLEGVSPEFHESFPVLASVMAGCEAVNGNAAVPALTLLLFWEGGALKGRIGRLNHPTCLWLTVDDPVKALDSIERTLASGGGDIRPAKR
jgi:hypothetical protein